jgi:hypothetical protein
VECTQFLEKEVPMGTLGQVCLDQLVDYLPTAVVDQLRLNETQDHQFFETNVILFQISAIVGRIRTGENKEGFPYYLVVVLNTGVVGSDFQISEVE